MKKKLNISLFGVTAILLLLWLVGFLVSMIIILSSDPISFSINLDKQTLERTDSLNLQYKISNWWPKEITDLKVNIQIIGKESLQKEFLYNNLEVFKDVTGNYTIGVNPMIPIGDYVIDANLTYVDKKGDVKSKWLTLQFKVIN